MTTALQAFGSVPRVIFVGQVIVQPVGGVTDTVNEQFDVLPEASRTEQFTVVVPSAKLNPDLGEQVGAPMPGQSSETVGVG